MAAQSRRALHCSSLRSVTRAAETPILFTLVALTALTIAATSLGAAEPEPNPGHALAQRFAEDAQRTRSAEAAKKEAASRAAAQRRKVASDKATKEKAWESEMLARARAEAEERRQLEAQAARLDALRMAREAKEAESARKEAENARLAEDARKAEEARVADEKRKAEEMHRVAEALRVAAERAAQDEARKTAEAQRVAEEKAREARRAEAERVAEQARRSQNERLAEEGRLAEAQRVETARKAEEAARALEATRRSEQAAWAAEERRRAEESQRSIKRTTEEETRRVGALETDAEVERVAARLRAIREQHLARHMRTERDAREQIAQSPPVLPAPAPDGAIGRLGVPPMSGPAHTASEPESAEVHQAADAPSGTYYDERQDGRVTILLQMEPSGHPGRRHESMDPILCLTNGCYVSNGPHHPASFLPGHKATRFGNAISRRAGACNRAYTCVFRDVEIGLLPAEVQPVDIRVLRHDRRAPESVDALSTCRGTDGRLACTGAIHGDGYTMWVIPESTAARLPIDLFGTTLESGLGHDPRAELVPRRGRW